MGRPNKRVFEARQRASPDDSSTRAYLHGAPATRKETAPPTVSPFHRDAGMYAPRIQLSAMSLFSSVQSTVSDLAKGQSTREGGGRPPTLGDNLRTQPLTFALACLGLMSVLAAKVLVMRRRSREDGSTRGR